MTFNARVAAASIMLALIAAGCQKPADKADTASAAPAIPASVDVQPFRVGMLQLAALKDGDIALPVSGEGLPWDAAQAAAALTEAGQPTDAIHLSVQPLLVRDGDRVVLIDSGAGGQMGTANRLLGSLRAAGVEPGQVTDVLISHAHGDHVGGLVDAQGRLNFPNAAIRMSAAEWEYAKAGAEAAGAGPLLAAITPKVQTFEPGAEVAPSITAVALNGHTPGHSGYEIVSGQDRLLYIGDAMHTPLISVGHPDWTNAWDEESDAATATRQALLARGATQGTRIYAVHFPFPGLGRFERRGEAYEWSPDSFFAPDTPAP